MITITVEIEIQVADADKIEATDAQIDDWIGFEYGNAGHLLATNPWYKVRGEVVDYHITDIDREFDEEAEKEGPK